MAKMASKERSQTGTGAAWARKAMQTPSPLAIQPQKLAMTARTHELSRVVKISPDVTPATIPLRTVCFSLTL